MRLTKLGCGHPHDGYKKAVLRSTAFFVGARCGGFDLDALCAIYIWGGYLCLSDKKFNALCAICIWVCIWGQSGLGAAYRAGSPIAAPKRARMPQA